MSANNCTCYEWDSPELEGNCMRIFYLVTTCTVTEYTEMAWSFSKMMSEKPNELSNVCSRPSCFFFLTNYWHVMFDTQIKNTVEHTITRAPLQEYLILFA